MQLQRPAELRLSRPCHGHGIKSASVARAVPALWNRNTTLKLRNKTVADAIKAPTAPAAQDASAEHPIPPDNTVSHTTAAAAEQQQQDEEKFNWHKAWYPVAALTALQVHTPNAVQLLGMRLVVWMDKQGSWQCFEDLCPHRLAPLSEGRIHESGQLQCTYHGWLFDSSGSCSSIPQISDPKAHGTACGSSRACVRAFPTLLLHDMLWVYADSSRETWAAAADGKLGLPTSAASEMLEAGWVTKSAWFQRDIPISFDVLLENLTDPAHVSHSHHGVIGDRNVDHRMSVTPLGPITAQGFKTLVHPAASSGMAPYELSYHAPALVKWQFPGPHMLLYVSPTDKGWSRMIMTFIGPKDSKATRPATPNVPPLLDWLITNVFEKNTALQHAVNRNAIIDGDSYFMHVSERTLYARGDHTSWGKQYYMPATADVAVIAWKKWIDRFGDQLPVLPKSAADLPPLLPREQVFDRYNQHTKHCPDCKAALRNTELAIGIAAVVAAVAAGSFVVAAVNAAAAAAAAGASGAAAAAAGGKLAAAAAAIAAVAGAIIAGLLKFRQLFIFVDYVHAAH